MMKNRSSLEGSSLGIGAAGLSLDQRGIPGGPRCLPRNAPDLTPRQAADTLRQACEEVRRIFIERGAGKVSRVKIKVDDFVRDKPRHFAACRTDGHLIVLAGELALQPVKTMTAIISHEFGHAVDFLYPGCFLIQPSGEFVVRRAGIRSNDAIPRSVMNYWEERDSDAVERTADLIAEQVMGIRIGYCGPCNLQTVLLGTPDESSCKPSRPKGLR